MNPSKHTRDQGTVETVDCSWRIEAEEGQGGSVGQQKVMATVFWDAHGIIHIDYLEKGKTITDVYYAELLDRFDADLK